MLFRTWMVSWRSENGGKEDEGDEEELGDGHYE